MGSLDELLEIIRTETTGNVRILLEFIEIKPKINKENEADFSEQVETHLMQGFYPTDTTAAGNTLAKIKYFDSIRYKNSVDELRDGILLCCEINNSIKYLNIVKMNFPEFIKQHQTRYDNNSQRGITESINSTIFFLEKERSRIKDYLIQKIIPNYRNENYREGNIF